MKTHSLALLCAASCAAGDVGDPGSGERIALWFGIVESLAKGQ